jgi:hypothetical protein
MFRMITITRVRHCTRALNGLSTQGCSTERVVGLVIVVGTKGLAIENIKRFVGKGFLP